MDRIRILFLASTPTDERRPNVEREFHCIEDALREFGDRFDCQYYPWPKRTNIVRKLREAKPHVVHFSGHGNNHDELLLVNAQGRSEPVGVADLEAMFSLIDEPERPRLVVFSACYSAHQAEAITRIVPCAVGVRSGILDSVTFDFATGFYNILGHGLSVDAALTGGRTAISGAVPIEQRPELHLLAGTLAEEIHFRASRPVARFPQDLHVNRIDQLECFAGMVANGYPRVLTITADAAMGKSSLVREMAKRADSDKVAVVNLDSAVKPEEILERLARSLRIDDVAITTPGTAALGQSTVHAAADRHRQLADSTRELLSAARQRSDRADGQVAVVLDAFDGTDGDVMTWLEKIFLPELLSGPAGVVCVVAGRRAPEIAIAPQLVRQDELENFGKEDIRQVLRDLRLDASDSAVQMAWAFANGQPFATRTGLYRLWRLAVGSTS